MSALSHISASAELFRSHNTSGTSSDALASDLGADPRLDLWGRTLDELLRWYSEAESLFVPEERPSTEVLTTAIDFVYEQPAGLPAPTLAAPSGGGRIVMEWHGVGGSTSVEFTGLGEFEVTEFRDGRVVRCETFRRDPRSRWEQLQTG
jgi:hypothetical protein